MDDRQPDRWTDGQTDKQIAVMCCSGSGSSQWSCSSYSAAAECLLMVGWLRSVFSSAVSSQLALLPLLTITLTLCVCVCVWNNLVTRRHQDIHVQLHSLPRCSSALMQLRKNLIKDRLSGRKRWSLIALDSCVSVVSLWSAARGGGGSGQHAGFASILGDVWKKDGLVTDTPDPHTPSGLSCTL